MRYAEAWRLLSPVAARLGTPRPSYSSVRRILLAERERKRRNSDELDRLLAGRREVELERAEEVADSRRRPLEEGPREAEDADRPVLHLRVAVDAAQPQEDESRHRVPGGSGVV